MKFKALASVIALAAAGVAHADIGNSLSSGTVELFATVFNANASITIDLGQDQDVLLSNLATPLNFTLSNDANWATFLSKAGSAALSWSVQSVDQDNVQGWTTARIGQEAFAGTPTGQARSNVGLTSAENRLVNFTNNVNADGDPTINVSTVALPGTAAYWNLDGDNTSTGFAKTSNAINSGAVSLFNFQTSVANPAPGKPYDWFKSTDTVTLNNVGGAYTLSFQGAATAPVPEPESYALALVGLAAIGFIARRRSV